MTTIQHLQKLVQRPSINLTGLAIEAGLAPEHLRAVVKGRRHLSTVTEEKLKPVLESLGCDILTDK